MEVDAGPMDVDDGRRRTHDAIEPDADDPVCNVCGGTARRPFNALALVPEYRTRIINEVYCSPQCAFEHMASHIRPSRPDLLRILRSRFEKYL